TITGGKFRAVISISEKAGALTVTVTGRVPSRFAPQKLYRSVTDPALHAAAIIAHWLEEAGIEVGSTLRAGKTPEKAADLLTWESRPLSEIVADMNKVSNNFIAEQTLKHLGAVKYGAPGSTEKGVSAAEEYLSSIGIKKGSYTLENGSGLSERTRISSNQLVSILVAAYRDLKIRSPFLESLSVMGIDGTTKKWRFAPELTGKIYVKTGTLNSVSTLAGYAPTPEGRVAAFAILANNLPRGAWPAKEAQMGVVRAIAGGER
ncbi:MAG TPA: D-alanyl-D-alanine carboxypeptidase/D-alanyl-D-alanine-endopeptidase, partial [bacterium]|nr:D-alanyl-D-alanine carboxypeptidase/D-alanyl-D-alanine-endopeptidase [bacterium]